MLEKFSEFDRRIICECLSAAANGPFFDDATFRILFSADRGLFLEIVARLPHLDDGNQDVRRAIGSSLANLTAYPHRKEAFWSEWISTSPSEVARINELWHSLLPPLQYRFMRVIGPTKFEQRFYRVIEYAVVNGGYGYTTQVWSHGKWRVAEEGPGGPRIMAAIPCSIDELESAEVDTEPFGKDYDPFEAD